MQVLASLAKHYGFNLETPWDQLPPEVAIVILYGSGGKKVPLVSVQHSLVLDMEAVNADIQHDLDDKGIAKTAREEKIRARNADMARKASEDAKMAKLYREVILKEKAPEGGFVPLGALGGIQPAAPKKAEKKEEVGSFGD